MTTPNPPTESHDTPPQSPMRCDECHVVDLAIYGHNWQCSQAGLTAEELVEKWKEAARYWNKHSCEQANP